MVAKTLATIAEYSRNSLRWYMGHHVYSLSLRKIFAPPPPSSSSSLTDPGGVRLGSRSHFYVLVKHKVPLWPVKLKHSRQGCHKICQYKEGQPPPPLQCHQRRWRLSMKNSSRQHSGLSPKVPGMEIQTSNLSGEPSKVVFIVYSSPNFQISYLVNNAPEVTKEEKGGWYQYFYPTWARFLYW